MALAPARLVSPFHLHLDRPGRAARGFGDGIGAVKVAGIGIDAGGRTSYGLDHLRQAVRRGGDAPVVFHAGPYALRRGIGTGFLKGLDRLTPRRRFSRALRRSGEDANMRCPQDGGAGVLPTAVPQTRTPPKAGRSQAATGSSRPGVPPGRGFTHWSFPRKPGCDGARCPRLDFPARFSRSEPLPPPASGNSRGMQQGGAETPPVPALSGRAGQ